MTGSTEERHVRLPRTKEGVQVQRFSDEVVLYDGARKRVHVLNPPAQFIWDHCDGTTSVESLVDEMARTFGGVSRDTLEQDVAATLKRFRDEGLVEELPPS